MLKRNVAKYVSRRTKVEILAGSEASEWVQVGRTAEHPERESFVVSADAGMMWPGSFMGTLQPLSSIDDIVHNSAVFGEIDAVEGSNLDMERSITELPIYDVSKKMTPEEKAERAAKAARKNQLKRISRIIWRDPCVSMSEKADPRNLGAFASYRR